jgi:uncharacterized protein YggE
VDYFVRPDYRPPQDNEEPTITRYTATNVVRVTLTDLAKLSDAIDTAIGAGANQVERVRFSLQEEQALGEQALREAAKKARGQADALAAALGVRVVRVLSASEPTTAIRPFADAVLRRADKAASATPFEVGPIEVSATVTLTVEVSSGPS